MTMSSYMWACLDTSKLFHLERKMRCWRKLYADDGVNIQRFIDEREIRPLLRKAGLTLQQPEQKLSYPWSLTKKFDYGYFPREEKIWDWFIVAWKSNEESS